MRLDFENGLRCHEKCAFWGCSMCRCALFVSDFCDSNSNRRAFNVESPSFTPANQQQVAGKKSTFSSQAASAAPFTPRGVGSECPREVLRPTYHGVSNSVIASTPTLQPQSDSTIFNPATIREFTPSNYDVGNTVSHMPSGRKWPTLTVVDRYHRMVLKMSLRTAVFTATLFR